MATRCARCSKETTATIMSMYNTDIICMDCKDEETQRPDYKEACEAERKAVQSGNNNFKGVYVVYKTPPLDRRQGRKE